jgi:tetrahydromethanopterin S-methyltransferase subunit D
MSMGTPIATRPGVGGTMTISAGTGQDGLVSAGVIRVSA